MDQIEQLCCEHEHDVEGQTMLLVYLGSLEKLWLAGRETPQFRQSWRLWNTKVSRIPICSKYFQVSYAYVYIYM